MSETSNYENYLAESNDIEINTNFYSKAQLDSEAAPSSDKNSNNTFKSKYLKYKKKYLELKTYLEAGDILSKKDDVQNKLKKLFIVNNHYKVTASNAENSLHPNVELKLKFIRSANIGKIKHRIVEFYFAVVDILNKDKVGGPDGKYKNIFEVNKDKVIMIRWVSGAITSGNLVTKLNIIQPDGAKKEIKFNVVTNSITQV